MSWIKNTGCKYHTQDTSYYCGAACAQMVLNEIGVNIASLDQDVLYTSNNTHNARSGWYSDPEGVRYTMVDRKPASFGNTFVVYRSSSEATGSQKLVYTLQHYGVSPIVLVYGCAHWIVVCGVQTDVNPFTGSYEIQGFWVNNPVFEDNAPHGTGDICGSGSSHGIENQWVSYASWQSTYFTGCNYDSSDGSLQYISVCDPEEPRLALPRDSAPVRHFNGREVAPAAAAARALGKDLERLGLARNKHTSRIARGQFAKPLLVERLDVEGEYYYLFPSVARGKVIGYAQVDARFGSLSGLYTLSAAAKPVETNVRTLAKRVTGMRLELPKEQGRVKLAPGKFKIDTHLVWKPCRQAFSPHLPFWRIRVGVFTFYQRIDGPIFSALTLGGRGI